MKRLHKFVARYRFFFIDETNYFHWHVKWSETVATNTPRDIHDRKVARNCLMIIHQMTRQVQNEFVWIRQVPDRRLKLRSMMKNENEDK